MMDVIIISTSHAHQEEYWQKRLKEALGYPLTHVICVTEDWEGGAGNGLGTLYAYLKACRKGKVLFNFDIDKSLKNGASVALYHTAGEGKRLYPLVGSEQGNKSAVKLPALLSGSEELISILEGVIRQTASLAPYRKGRLSVFWGDQIFIPENPDHIPRHHIEITTQEVPFPSTKEWLKRRYDSYGLVVLQNGNVNYLFEKLAYSQLEALIGGELTTQNAHLGLNLGSFSLSYPVLKAFLELFAHELESREGRLDTDIDFWMPLILNEELYLRYILYKQFSFEQARNHYQRMQCLKSLFPLKQQLVGTCDIGIHSQWWDYGNLEMYFKNSMNLLEEGKNGETMRTFFGWSGKDLANGSLLINSRISSGSAKNCILINVEAQDIDLSHCIVLNSHLYSLKAQNCLLYQVRETSPLILNQVVRADASLDQYYKMYSKIDQDGKRDWEIRLPNNPISFQDLQSLTRSFCRAE